MRVSTAVILTMVLACGTAFAGTATYTGSDDDVLITGTTITYNATGFNMDDGVVAPIPLPTDSGTMTGITPGPFTYTVMFDSPIYFDYNAGPPPEQGRFVLAWTILPSTDHHLHWESYFAIGDWTVIPASDLPPTGAETPVNTLAGMRIVNDGTTVEYEYTVNGTDWITHGTTLTVASLPAGNYEFGLWWGGAPPVDYDVDEIELTGGNIPDVNQAVPPPPIEDPVPVAGIVGIGIVAAACALGGAVVLRRKR